MNKLLLAFDNKKILVTGGAGFIGSNLVDFLSKSRAQIVVLDAMKEGLGGNLFNLSGCSSRIHFLKADLSDVKTYDNLATDFDFVFNLSGNISHVDSMNQPLADLSMNTQSQLMLLEFLRKKNPGAVVVFTGTRQVYGAPKYLPVNEAHPISPVDVNGIHKLAAEQYHLLYAKVYGLKTVCFRLTNTYGPRQLISHARQGFIGWFLNRALLGETIELFGGGSQKRDFTYVDDVVHALLLGALNEKCFGDFFNLNGELATLEDIAQKLIVASGKGKLKIVPFPPEKKKIDIGDYYCTAKKFEDLTGWKAKVSLDLGLKNMVDYFKEHQAQYLGGEAK